MPACFKRRKNFVRSFKRSELVATKRFLEGIRDMTAEYAGSLIDKGVTTNGADRSR
jgi:hypothetical protein